MSALRTDVVVVGAGLAGLVAARRLQAQGLDVRVLEARERVGGRTYTREIAGLPVDVGGTWVGPTQERVLALAAELGLQTEAQLSAGRTLMEVDGRVRSYRGTIPSLPPWGLIELHRAIARVDKLAAQVSADAPWASERAREWDGWSVGAWIQANVRTRSASGAMIAAVRSIFSAEPAEVSLLYFLWYVQCAGGIMPLCDVEGGAQERRIVGGAQQLCERLAEPLGASVLLAEPVRSITSDDAGVTVHTDGLEVAADRAIIALPPHLAARIRWLPELPARRDQLTQRMPIGSSIKLICAYERPFWRAAGLSGEVLSNRGPVSLGFDVGPAGDGAGPGLMMAFLLGDAARAWTDREPAARREAVVRDLTRLLGEQASAPLEVIEHDWNADPWARGCSVGLCPPGAITACGETIREPVGRLYFAGTETATRWAGFMDGAIESGERAAEEVLLARGAGGGR